MVALLGVWRSDRRETARERNLLVNQLMHLAGRTWQEPPAEEISIAVALDDGEPDLIRPSQHFSL